jgi:hypothetical protein
MLTLDPTTLFYFSLRHLDFKNNHAGLIQDWATKIPHNASQEVLAVRQPLCLPMVPLAALMLPHQLGLLLTLLKSVTMTMASKSPKAAFRILTRPKAMSETLPSRVLQNVNKGLQAQ